MTRSYSCLVRLNNGTTTRVTITVDFGNDVKPIIESQYGAGSYISCRLL